MDPEALARALFELVPLADEYADDLPLLIGEGEWQELPEDEPPLLPITADAAGIVRELAAALKNANWQPGQSRRALPLSGNRTFGSVIQRAAIRKIHRGYLEPFRRFPVVKHVPELVVQFLTQIPGWSSYIKRENHPGVGWHYHYLADPRTRSDVILAWDTRWVSPSNEPQRAHQSLRPLFQEKHGERKANFSAKPWLWGDTKKESIFKVCVPDLVKWHIREFRCASNNADPVWPITAKLTPIVVATPAAAQHVKGKKRQR